MSARVSWPGDVSEGPWGAKAVLTWLASLGVSTTAVSIQMCADDSPEGIALHMTNIYQTMLAHDLYLALTALRELDPAKADEVADRTVLAAVCGDSYGEWLFQWATEQGLDAQAIADEARELYAFKKAQP